MTTIDHRTFGHEDEDGNRARTGVVFLVALTLLIGAAGYVVLREPTGSCPEAIEQAEPAETTTTTTYVLVDLHHNGPEFVDEIADQLRDTIESVVDGSGAMHLTVDHGLDTTLVVSDCLDGTRAFEVTRNNPTRQQQARAALVDDLTDQVKAELRHSPAKREGSPLRLLQEGAAHAAAANDAGHPAEVVIYSNFVAVGSDCLSTDKVAGTAEEIADRVQACEEAGVLRTYDSSLRIIGAGTTDMAKGREQWTRDYASAICEAVAPGRCSLR